MYTLLGRQVKQMTVLNVEHFNRFNMLHEGTRFFILIVIFISIVITGSSLICGSIDRDVKLVKIGIFLLAITVMVIACMVKAYHTETDYISEKYVMFEDDKVPIEEFIDWEIVDFKGPIYILAPRDGKKIKDSERNS